MSLFAYSPNQLAAGQIAVAAFLALAGFFLLLPRPRQPSVWGGIAALIAAAAVFAVWLTTTYGNPMPDVVGTVLFWLFSAGALVFGSILVIQHNPARGAIAFAFVILSTCGLFLLLAAPFLMAATIIIYAGAIIVTFLFVLMLSHPRGESNENDRSREPLFGALAGFSFVGLVLFALYVTAIGKGEVRGEGAVAAKEEHRLPVPELTVQEREKLSEVIAKLDAADEQLNGDLNKDVTQRLNYFDEIKESLSTVIGNSDLETHSREVLDGTLRNRLEKETPGKTGAGAVLYREDQPTRAVLNRAAEIRKQNWMAYQHLEELLLEKKGTPAELKAELRQLRDEIVLLNSAVDLPARNVENLGYLLYADHLLDIELAGTLLLVATIGAVAIAHRKRAVA